MSKKLFSVLTVLLIISFLHCPPAHPAAPAPAPAATQPAAPAAQPTVACSDHHLRPATPASTNRPRRTEGRLLRLRLRATSSTKASSRCRSTPWRSMALVFAFDGKSDSATMTANVDQVLAQGMDAATRIWDYETVKPAVREASRSIVMTSFFSPWATAAHPTARSDEAGISFAMGVEMATQWKAAYPDKPIVMVELGWPSHVEVKIGIPTLGQGRPLRRPDCHRPGLPRCR